MTTYISKQSDETGVIHWSAEENQIWADLIKRQLGCIEGKACQEYMDGLAQFTARPYSAVE